MDSYEASIYSAVLITAVVLGSSIVYFVVSVFRHQRNYYAMQQAWFADEINLLEKERSRIARDMHDEIGPLVHVTQTYLGQLRPQSDTEAAYLEKAKDYLGQLVKRTHGIAVDLTPTALTGKGLEFTLRQLFDDLADLYPLQFNFQYEVDGPVDSSMGIHLYRIVQEITHNTIKHAKASRLRVHFRERKGRLYLFCGDDGTGFSLAAVRENKQGLGLGSLQSRTALLKGKVTIKSAPGTGTEYFFEFPLIKKT